MVATTLKPLPTPDETDIITVVSSLTDITVPAVRPIETEVVPVRLVPCKTTRPAPAVGAKSGCMAVTEGTANSWRPCPAPEGFVAAR